MRILYLLIALLSFSTFAAEDVFELMEVNGAKDFFAKQKGVMTKIIIAQDPSLAPQRDIVEQWENKYFSWARVSLSIAPIYLSRFNEQEIAELVNFYKTGQSTAFYQTPTGRKLQQEMPAINQDFSRFGYEYMQEVSPFLADMLKENQPL